MPEARPVAFTQVRPREQSRRDAATSAAIEIEFGGYVIRVRAGTDMALLEAVLALVSRC